MQRKKNRIIFDVFILDDSFFIRQQIYKTLSDQSNFKDSQVFFNFKGDCVLKQEFLDLLPEIKSDIFFIDTELEDGTGWDTVTRIKELNKNAYIVILSDGLTPEYQLKRDLYESETFATIDKPVQPGTLCRMAERIYREELSKSDNSKKQTQKKGNQKRGDSEFTSSITISSIAPIVPFAVNSFKKKEQSKPRGLDPIESTSPVFNNPVKNAIRVSETNKSKDKEEVQGLVFELDEKTKNKDLKTKSNPQPSLAEDSLLFKIESEDSLVFDIETKPLDIQQNHQILIDSDDEIFELDSTHPTTSSGFLIFDSSNDISIDDFNDNIIEVDDKNHFNETHIDKHIACNAVTLKETFIDSNEESNIDPINETFADGNSEQLIDNEEMFFDFSEPNIVEQLEKISETPPISHENSIENVNIVLKTEKTDKILLNNNKNYEKIIDNNNINDLNNNLYDNILENNENLLYSNKTCEDIIENNNKSEFIFKNNENTTNNNIKSEKIINSNNNDVIINNNCYVLTEFNDNESLSHCNNEKIIKNNEEVLDFNLHFEEEITENINISSKNNHEIEFSLEATEDMVENNKGIELQSNTGTNKKYDFFNESNKLSKHEEREEELEFELEEDESIANIQKNSNQENKNKLSEVSEEIVFKVEEEIFEGTKHNDEYFEDIKTYNETPKSINSNEDAINEEGVFIIKPPMQGGLKTPFGFGSYQNKR